MPADPTDTHDRLLAAICAAGLYHNVIARPDVVRWADAEIARRSDVPTWLINLSMSQRLFELDVIGLLNDVAAQVDPESVCRGLYALLPDPAGYAYDQCATLAKHAYQITHALLRGDWRRDLLAQADIAADNFGWVRDSGRGLIDDHMVPMTHDEAILGFRKFLDDNSNPTVAIRLNPVRWKFNGEIEDY
jgi:hypothetical protein